MLPIHQIALYVFLSFAQFASCELQFQRPEDLPAVNYDFVVAGGGTAGVAVASRLSENPTFRVLVIEAGPSNDEIFDSLVPGLSHNINGFGTRVDWNYTTAPQVHVGGEVVTYPRAMMLGGCSSHNGMAYTRGSRDDYDHWASIANDDNLSWNKILPYILKAEKWSGPNDPSLSEQNHFDPSLHNFHGKIGVSAPYYPHPFNDMLFEATNNSGGEFPFLPDLNSGRPIGLGWGQETIANGFRSSSAASYLPQTGDNLHVLLNTRVTRILSVEHDKGHGQENSPDFRTVEFATSAEGPRHTITATKEVIVSGGVISSPQILLNSGIGPKGDLEALGVRSIIDNPSVGQNLSDQPAVTIRFTTDLAVTDFNETIALAEWTATHTGRLALPSRPSTIGWVRLSDDADVFRDGTPDPTAGKNSPHIEFYFLNISSQNVPAGTGNSPPLPSTTANIIPGFVDLGANQEGNASFSMTVVDLHPIARGSITISSPLPFSPPVIDLNLLGSPVDKSILIEGILSAQRLFTSPAFSKNIFGLAAPAPSSGRAVTKADTLQLIETQTTHFGHGVGSCSMAPHGAKWGVVDPDFRVRGAKGLRVVDASVIPYVTSGHMQAPVYAIAEWASTVIRRGWE